MDKIEKILSERLENELFMYHKQLNKDGQELIDKLLIRWGDDTVYSEEHRFILLEMLIPNIKDKKILDMASGCGSFVIQGLIHGYNTYGIEPEDWKHEVIDLKFQKHSYDKQWRDRLVKGYGENLPFASESFDVFDSWQTIEHVGNEEECIKELYRVLKKGGVGILRGPDYFCFYEGHYRMFWFPMMGDGLFAKLYLKLRNRPYEGLQTFHPVNPYRIKRYARNAGFKVINIKKKQIDEALQRKFPILKKTFFKPFLWSFYRCWNLYKGILNFGRSESTISLLMIKD